MTEYGKKKQQIELPPLPIIAVAMIIVAGIAGIALYATQSSSVSHVGPSQPISSNPAVILPEKNYCDEACDTRTPKTQGLYRLEKKIGPYNLLPYKEASGYPPTYTLETKTFQLFGGESELIVTSHRVFAHKINWEAFTNSKYSRVIIIEKLLDKNSNSILCQIDKETGECFFRRVIYDKTNPANSKTSERGFSDEEYLKSVQWEVKFFVK